MRVDTSTRPGPEQVSECFVLVLAALLMLACPTTAAAPTADRGDTAVIGGVQLRGVQAVASRYKNVEEVAKVTAANGIDEVYLKDVETGQLYLAHGTEGALAGAGKLRTGFVGQMNGRMVEVVHVDDESNTFLEGFTDTWKGLGTIVKKSVFDNFLATLAVGTTGAVVASVLSAGKLAGAATVAAGATATMASGAASGMAAAGATAGATAATATVGAASVSASLALAAKAALLGLLPVLKAAAVAMVVGASIASVAYGLYSKFRKRNQDTISMVTADSVDRLPGSPLSGTAPSPPRAPVPIPVSSPAPARETSVPPTRSPGPQTTPVDDTPFGDLPLR